MAKADVKMPEEFLDRLTRLGAAQDEIAGKVLEAGAEIVEAKVRSNLIAVIGKDTAYPSRSTGELVSALGITQVRVNRNGDYDIKIGFAEPRPDGESNAKIANTIEYGRHGQPAKPFLAPAKAASRKACIEAMIRKFEEETGKI
ncbi:MAG: HK97 gp10 family phage protein [Clostridia bacterium]|nr:HK97 gp10 family phage protein [Clostridia bacterium]